MGKTVVHIADFTTPHAGGFISSLKVLAAEAKAKGYQVVMVFPAAAEKTAWALQLQQSGFVLRFLPSNLTLFALIRRIKSVVCEEKADLLHTHFSNYNFPAAIVSLLSLFTNRKIYVVWHFHSDWRTRLTLLRRMKDFILYRLLGRVTFGIAVSESIRAEIGGRGMPLHRIKYVPNGFDAERLGDCDKDRDTLRGELGIPQQTRVFLAFGWEPITKGVDLLLAAFAQIGNGEKCYKVGLLLIGKEPMLQYVNEWTRGGKPSWLYLADPRERVAELYAVSDVFISASRSEGFSYSVVEAMASRLPVISSDIPGVAWAKGVQGVISFSPCDVPDLVRGITEVISWSDAQWNSNVNANRSFVIEKYSLQTWARNILEVYDTILNTDMIQDGKIR